MMKPLFTKLFLSVLCCSASVTLVYSQLFEWRGPGELVFIMKRDY